MKILFLKYTEFRLNTSPGLACVEFCLLSEWNFQQNIVNEKLKIKAKIDGLS